MNEKVWKIGCCGILIPSISIIYNARAACTPAPNCASIGYTETSCEGDSLKCPFDITKMKCMPCDNDFKYNCIGNNIKGGIGTTCGGKYVSCECSNSNYTFNNGECTGATCPVGYIYYSDGSCSHVLSNNKTPIGVVVKDNALVMSKERVYITWSYEYIDTTELTNHNNDTDARTDYNGKNNTLAIVSAHRGEPNSQNAAIYCNSYATEGTGAGDWYLPAVGEIYDYVYRHYNTVSNVFMSLGISDFDAFLWASTEHNNQHAWGTSLSDGAVAHFTKDEFTYPASCFLEI